VGRLKEKAGALEEMSREIVGLKNELANASGKVERERHSFEQATQLQLSVLKEENRRLTAEVAVSTHKLQETEDAVRVGLPSSNMDKISMFSCVGLIT
jgi:predicted nuclease with TOPRIM domain